MRVLLSVGWLGGAGGAERNAHSIIRALSAEEVDVVTRVRLSGRLSEVNEGVRVFSPLGWRWRYANMSSGMKGTVVQEVVNPIRARILPKYDVYIQLRSGASIGSTIQADLRILIPSGGQVGDAMAHEFDFVAMQAPDNGMFLPDGVPCKLLPPPVYPLTNSRSIPVAGLPDKFYLTVFNPYDPFKGASDLHRIAGTSPYPIVWCHSEATTGNVMPPELRSNPHILHIESPTPEELRYLYERCVAYLSFSHWEGFGWSIADALRYSRCVVSRPVGALSYPESQNLPSVRLLGKEWSINWSELEDDPVQELPSELPWISPEQFHRTLTEFVSVSKSSASGPSPLRTT